MGFTMQVTQIADADKLPDAAEYYSTAFHAGIGRHCSIVKVDRYNKQYKVNFGHADVWIDACELSRFVI